MKVVIIAPCFGAFGGIEAFVFELSEMIQKQGHEVSVLFKKVKGFELKNSLEERVNKSDLAIQFIERSSLIGYRKILCADIVHLHNPLVEYTFFSRLVQKPCVATVYNWCRGWGSLRTVSWQLANRLVDSSWYISEFVWNTWEPRGRRKDSARLPIVSKLPEGFVEPVKRKGFLFVGRWIPNKGLRSLVQAYAKLKVDPVKWPLVLIGTGSLKEEVLGLIKDLDIKGVEITGFISDEDRNTRIKSARWMVTPANTKEDLGLTPLEARNVSVPCIVTRDGGLNETGGKCSLKCEPGDEEGLRQQLQRAVEMSDEEYSFFVKGCSKGLEEYVRPLTVYLNEYQKLL